MENLNRPSLSDDPVMIWPPSMRDAVEATFGPIVQGDGGEYASGFRIIWQDRLPDC